jgi:hypothetical protein
MVSTTESIEDDIVAGGWRLLCVGLLHQAAVKVDACSRKKKKPLYQIGSQPHRLQGSSGLDKEVLKQRAQARDWVRGGIGAVTFEDACDAIGVDPSRARKKILERAESQRKKWGVA